MTPAARLAATIALLAEIETSPRPADQVASFYFKGRRYIGAKDRRAVAESVWRVLRRRARLDWWLGTIGHADRSARALVLADLAIESGKPKAEMFEGVHAAAPPNPDERRMIDLMTGKSLFHRDMPTWVRSEYPAWMEPRLSALFGDGLNREMGAMRDEAPLDLRVSMVLPI